MAVTESAEAATLGAQPQIPFAVLSDGAHRISCGSGYRFPSASIPHGQTALGPGPEPAGPVLVQGRNIGVARDFFNARGTDELTVPQLQQACEKWAHRAEPHTLVTIGEDRFYAHIDQTLRSGEGLEFAFAPMIELISKVANPQAAVRVGTNCMHGEPLGGFE